LSLLTPGRRYGHHTSQVLNLSGNRLRALPSDLGWLSLKQLSITDNPDLQVPTHVLQKGLRWAVGLQLGLAACSSSGNRC
jgi:hypothetical protein